MNTNFTSGINIKVPYKQREMTAKPSKYPQGSFKNKDCKWCGESFTPIAPSHHYCSLNCRKDSHGDNHYMRKYGISIKWVQDQLDKQAWKCAICREFGFKMRGDHVSGLNVDHCHTTGKVRALLCHNCNRGLGLFQENTDYLLAAINYIKTHNDV
jgi:hypothetical protein